MIRAIKNPSRKMSGAALPWCTARPPGGSARWRFRWTRTGVATISSAMADQGAGTYTILSEIVAEELKIPLSQIRIRQLDTQTGIKDTGVGGSRATRVYGNAGYTAALKAVEAIKQKRRRSKWERRRIKLPSQREQRFIRGWNVA